MRCLTVFALLAVLAVIPAHAEPWYRGPHGRNRVFHLSLSTGLGIGYVLSESVFKPSLASDECRWCDPPSLDASIRDALVWDDYDRARSISDLTGYVATPVFTLGISALGSLRADDAGWARLIDDTIPILESVAISQALTQIVKFSFARARPFVHYRNPGFGHDNNMSFFSGHSSLVFALSTGAGMIAHWRESRAEPLVWGVGLSLSAATAYLRIAADRHYFTDVVTGSVVGAVAGLTIPYLMRRHGDVAIVPSGNGLSLAGMF